MKEGSGGWKWRKEGKDHGCVHDQDRVRECGCQFSPLEKEGSPAMQ